MIKRQRIQMMIGIIGNKFTEKNKVKNKNKNKNKNKIK